MLQNKSVLITGATGGIGAAIAKAFAAQGADLILCGRDSDALQALHVKIISRYRVRTFLHAFDLSDPDAIKALFTTLHQEKITPDILINNAGIMDGAPLGMTTLPQIHNSLAINTIAPLLMAQYASRAMMRAKKTGCIINISSIIASQGFENQSLYASSKAAIEGMTRALSRELAPTIRVNAIAPGFIATKLTENIDSEAIVARTPLGRVGTPEDVANAALFLASEMASFITGEILEVSGGLRL
jgi:3-oxoacyl-[acyl-carrier protein] reductase